MYLTGITTHQFLLLLSKFGICATNFLKIHSIKGLLLTEGMSTRITDTRLGRTEGCMCMCVLCQIRRSFSSAWSPICLCSVMNQEGVSNFLTMYKHITVLIHNEGWRKGRIGFAFLSAQHLHNSIVLTTKVAYF